MSRIKTKGNKTKNHDNALKPILHNHDRINVYTKANNKLLKTANT